MVQTLNKKHAKGQRPIRKPEVTRLSLNWRLLLVSVFLLVVAVGAGYFHHSRQLDRCTVALLERAGQLEEDEQWAEAASYLYRYVQVRPDDADVWPRLARTYTKYAMDVKTWPVLQRAIELHHRALGRIAPPEKDSPDSADARPEQRSPDSVEIKLREGLAGLLLRIGSYREAKEAVKSLGLSEGGRDSVNDVAMQGHKVFLRASALADYGVAITGDQKAKQNAYQALLDALDASPGDIDLAVAASRLLRNERTLFQRIKNDSGEETLGAVLDEPDRHKKADQIINTAVNAEENRHAPEAFFARYAYRRDYRQPGAEEDLRKSLELDPDNYNALIPLGWEAIGRSQAAPNTSDGHQDADPLPLAAEYFQRAIELQPTRADGYVGLGTTRFQQGQRAEASRIWRNGTENVTGNKTDLYFRLASALIREQKLEQAQDLVDDGLKPEIDRVIRTTPNLDQRDTTLLQGRGDLLDAEIALARLAVGQTEQPEQTDAFARLESLLRISRDMRLATQQLALHLEALNVMGRVYVRRQQWADAVACYKRAMDRASNPERYTLAAIDTWALAARQALIGGGENAQVEAAQLLANGEKIAPNSPLTWNRLTLLYEQLNRGDDADRALARFEKTASDPLAHPLLKSRLLVLRGQFEQAEELLEQSSRDAAEGQRDTVLRRIVNLHVRSGDTDALKSALEELNAINPHDLSIVRPLAELALQAGEGQAAQRWENELRKIEGNTGIWWRYTRAQRLLLGSPSEEAYQEVSRLQEELQSADPKSPSGFVLKAELLARQERLDEAVQTYKRAIELGANKAATYERLIQLLMSRGDLQEADEYLGRLQSLAISPSLVSDSSNSLSVSLAAQMDRPTEALRRAQKWVTLKPSDALARVVLGKTLENNGFDDEAEQAYLEATRLAEKDVKTWNALFMFYRSRDDQAARTTLQTMVEKADLPGSAKASILARGLELLGDLESAEPAFRKAIDLDPENIQPRLRLAAILSQRDVDAAETELDKVLEMDPSSMQGLRMLAALRAVQNREDAWREVEEVLGSSVGGGSSSDADRRWRAALLARVGGTTNIAKARETLESLVLDNRSARADDRVLLARIYEAEANVDAAGEQYKALADSTDSTSIHLARYTDFLIRHKEQDAAEQALNRLDRLTSGSAHDQRFLFVALQARVLSMAGQTSESATLVEDFARSVSEKLETDPQKVRWYARFANLYTSLKMHEAAEPWLEKTVALAPQTFPALVKTLTALSRHEEALQLCIDHKPEKISLSLVNTVLVVLANDPPAIVFEQAEPLLRQAMADNPDDADVIFAVGTVGAIQGHYESSLELFAQAHKLRPKHVLTLNNLATLLAELPGREAEAMDYVNQAIEMAGEQPFLLDTKGIILTHAGKLAEAVAVLRQATAGPSVDARFYLHLAAACDRIDAPAEARQALEKALAGDLESTILTQSDETILDELRRKLTTDN